jgi:hypothetical protein
MPFGIQNKNHWRIELGNPEFAASRWAAVGHQDIVTGCV